MVLTERLEKLIELAKKLQRVHEDIHIKLEYNEVKQLREVTDMVNEMTNKAVDTYVKREMFEAEYG